MDMRLVDKLVKGATTLELSQLATMVSGEINRRNPTPTFFVGQRVQFHGRGTIRTIVIDRTNRDTVGGREVNADGTLGMKWRVAYSFLKAA
jgi:hypothetical protein